MLTIIIIIILFIGTYAGIRRGLVLQLIHTAGYIFSFYLAHKYYLVLASHLEMLIPYSQPGVGDEMIYYDTVQILNLDHAFYNAISFLLIIVAGWLVTRIIGYMLNSLTFLPVIRQLNSIGGGLLGFLMQYLGVFLLLYFLTLIPFEYIQNLLGESSLANWIIRETPFFSSHIYEWWVGISTQL